MRILKYKKNIALITTSYLILFGLMLAPTASVVATGLKITPLKYEESIDLGANKVGHIDVANPGDFNITVRTSVEAFRQINSRGDLEFFSDEHYTEGIVVDVDEFELGPREAARIQFRVISNKLPEGGVYAAIFFETDAQAAADNISSVSTTARVGTLLILENGDGERTGEIERLDVPFWQFASGLRGMLSYANHEGEVAVGYNPVLISKVLPWGEKENLETGLVLPGSTRDFAFEREGSYLGLLPVTVHDADTNSKETAWVFAVTGLWRLTVPFLVVVIFASLALQRYFKAK